MDAHPSRLLRRVGTTDLDVPVVRPCFGIELLDSAKSRVDRSIGARRRGPCLTYQSFLLADAPPTFSTTFHRKIPHSSDEQPLPRKLKSANFGHARQLH